ncbi:MAG: patatin-like phospholipase family protein [Gemmatimonadaceae bacterium]
MPFTLITERLRVTATALLCLACSVPALAQGQGDATTLARHPGPRIGLALSGGGARGLAHLGVLRALERAGVRIDAIAGTSMGSLVGGLYASGYSAGDLERIALDIDWIALFDDTPDVAPMEPFAPVRGNTTLLSLPMHRGRIGLPSGVIAGQQVSELFSRLTWPVRSVRDFRKLPIAFSAVATDLSTGAAVVLDSGSLAGAMRASMSLPSVFAPAALNGRLLLDGGLSRNLPAQDARALGADVVICSDVSEPLLDGRDLHSIVDVLNQAVSFHGSESTLEERRRCDVYIRPDLTGLGYLSFDRTADWIERGDSATRLVAAQLRQLVSVTGGAAAPPRGIPPADRARPVLLKGATIVAATAEARTFVAATLDLHRPPVVDPDRMKHATAPAYASGLFETVTYSVLDTDSGAVALIAAQGDNADRVDFGFHYDDRYNAALLFNATMRHLLGFGSTGRLSLRLGEQTRVAVDVSRGRTIRSHWVMGTGAAYFSTPLDFYADGHRAAEVTMRVTSVNVTAGAAIGGGGGGLQLKGEHAHASAAISPVDSTQQRTFASAAALLWWDDMDRPAFPTRGAALQARYERAGLFGPSFSRRYLGASAAVPITSRLSLHARATVGATTPDSTIPLSYRYYLGSLTPSAVLAEAQVPFAGLHVQERNGFAVAQLGAAAQWEAVPNVFVTVRGDVGNVAATVNQAIDSRIVGLGLSVGTRTLAGPLEIRVHGRSFSTMRLEFSAGHIF